MAESAALLVDEVLPEQPMRQWVLSVPYPLRFLFASRPMILSQVLGIVYRLIARHLIDKAGFAKKTAQTGAVTLIQRFGSALNLNIHFHMLFLDGVYAGGAKGSATRFRWVKAPRDAELTQLVHAIAQRVGRFDYNATTPVAPEVVAAMLPYLVERFGNPSSSHVYGQQAAQAVREARVSVARLIGASPEEIVFTGCATEANNLALLGVARARGEGAASGGERGGTPRRDGPRPPVTKRRLGAERDSGGSLWPCRSRARRRRAAAGYRTGVDVVLYEAVEPFRGQVVAEDHFAYGARGVYQIIRRQDDDSESFRDMAAPIDQHRQLQVQLPCISGDVGGFVADVDRDHGKAPRAVFVIGRLHERHFLAARHAPGRPEGHQHRTAAQLLEIDSLALQIAALQRRRGLSDEASSRRAVHGECEQTGQCGHATPPVRLQ